VLQCGHCYCKSCLTELKRHSQNKRNLNCPVCRENTALGEISYVNTKTVKEEQPEEEPLPDNLMDLEKLVEVIKVRKHSAKAEVIVEKLKEILRKHPEDKVLIFSAVSEKFPTILLFTDLSSNLQWTDMLDIMHRALTENGILCAQTKSGKKFQEAIQLFKASAFTLYYKCVIIENLIQNRTVKIMKLIY
jgi:hypothetical protein